MAGRGSSYGKAGGRKVRQGGEIRKEIYIDSVVLLVRSQQGRVTGGWRRESVERRQEERGQHERGR